MCIPILRATSSGAFVLNQYAFGSQSTVDGGQPVGWQCRSLGSGEQTCSHNLAMMALRSASTSSLSSSTEAGFSRQQF